MRMASLAIVALSAALAACGGDRPPVSEVNGANSQSGGRGGIRIANPFHDELMKARPGGQRNSMFRAIRNSREQCRQVTNAGYQEEYANMRMWVARCEADQKSYAVFIAANGDAQVRDCEEMGQLELPRCEGLPPPVPDEFAPKIVPGAADNAFRNDS